MILLKVEGIHNKGEEGRMRSLKSVWKWWFFIGGRTRAFSYCHSPRTESIPLLPLLLRPSVNVYSFLNIDLTCFLFSLFLDILYVVTVNRNSGIFLPVRRTGSGCPDTLSYLPRYPRWTAGSVKLPRLFPECHWEPHLERMSRRLLPESSLTGGRGLSTLWTTMEIADVISFRN